MMEIKHHTKLSLKERIAVAKILEQACTPVEGADPPEYRYADGWNSNRIQGEVAKAIGRIVSSNTVGVLRRTLFGIYRTKSARTGRSRWQNVDPATIETMAGRIQALHNNLSRASARIKSLDDRVKFLESALGVSSPAPENGAGETVELGK